MSATSLTVNWQGLKVRSQREPGAVVERPIDDCRRRPSRLNCEPTREDVFLDKEALSVERSARIAAHRTLLRTRVLEKVLEALLELGQECWLQPRVRYVGRKVLRTVRCPTLSTPPCLFGIEYEDERSRNHRTPLRRDDDDDEGCSKLELVPELERGDDDALSEIKTR